MTVDGGLSGDGYLMVNEVECNNIEVEDSVSTPHLSILSGGQLKVYDDSFELDDDPVTWQHTLVVTSVDVTLPSLSRSSQDYFAVCDSNFDITGRINGRLVTSWSQGSVTPHTTTIHYLGKAAT